VTSAHRHQVPVDHLIIHDGHDLAIIDAFRLDMNSRHKVIAGSGRKGEVDERSEAAGRQTRHLHLSIDDDTTGAALVDPAADPV
jgi:hypothetical protein